MADKIDKNADVETGSSCSISSSGNGDGGRNIVEVEVDISEEEKKYYEGDYQVAMETQYPGRKIVGVNDRDFNMDPSTSLQCNDSWNGKSERIITDNNNSSNQMQDQRHQINGFHADENGLKAGTNNEQNIDFQDHKPNEHGQTFETIGDDFDIYKFACEGNMELIRKYIENGSVGRVVRVCNLTLGEEETCFLHKVVHARCSDILQALLYHGAYANVQDAQGQTPLHVAVRLKLIGMVEILLQRGADVNVQDDDGKTPIQYCILIDHEPSPIDRSIASILLPSMDINICDFDGLSILHILSFWDLWSQLETAIALSKTARLKDNRGRHPLHFCFLNPRLIALDAAFVLLKTDASLLLKDNDGNTPMHLLMDHPLSHGNFEVARFVKDFICSELRDPTGVSLLHISCSANDCNLIRFLSHCRVNLEEPDPDSNPPLYSAIANNQTEMVRTLLQCGANPNVYNNSVHESALHCAANHSRITATKMLLAEGADPLVQDERGRTPLHYAVHTGSIDVAKLLLQSNAGDVVNALDSSGSLPLHYAAAENKLNLVELLISKRSKVNVMDVEGRTPLHLAVLSAAQNPKEDASDVIRVLILHRASVNEYDKFGQTPLHIAAGADLSDIVQILMNRGADATLWDAEGRNVQALALETGRTRVINVMKEHRDSMIRYSQENLVELDNDDFIFSEKPNNSPKMSRSRSNMVACISNQTLDGIDECEDVLVDDDYAQRQHRPQQVQATSSSSNGLSALSTFESNPKKRRFPCCVIL